MKVILPGPEVMGLLCDISGVLSESSAEGDGVAIPGSVQAIKDFRQVRRFYLNQFTKDMRQKVKFLFLCTHNDMS